MQSIILKIENEIVLHEKREDPLSFVTQFSYRETHNRDIELTIKGRPLKVGANPIRHEKVEIHDKEGVLVFKGKDIDTVFTVCHIYLYLKDRRYDKDNIEEIRTIIKNISRMEFDYKTRKTMANLLDEGLFSQLKDEICYSRNTIFDIKWGDEQTQLDRFIKSFSSDDCLIANGIFNLVSREDAEIFLSFLIRTRGRILVCLPNKSFNRYLKVENRSAENKWEPNRDEFLDFINSCIRGKGISFKFYPIGDRVNDNPMSFTAYLTYNSLQE